MTVSANSSAPSAAAPTSAAAAQQPATPSATRVSAVSTQSADHVPASGENKAPSEWNDDLEKQFFELAKKSPYRAKIKGEDKAIDSKQSLLELLGHAQRGIGASKAVEEAKKTRAEAEKEVAQARELVSLFDRAKKGDFEARKQLGLVTPNEQAEEQKQWEAIPPEVRAVIEQNARLEQEREELAAKLNERESTEKQRAERAHLDQLRSKALDHTIAALEPLGITKETGEHWLKYAVDAISSLEAEGLEIGVDMTPEILRERIAQLESTTSLDNVAKLPPQKVLAAFEKVMTNLNDEELLSAVPSKIAARISTAVARRRLASKNQPAPTPQSSQTKDKEQPEPRKPEVLRLSPFRW